MINWPDQETKWKPLGKPTRQRSDLAVARDIFASAIAVPAAGPCLQPDSIVKPPSSSLAIRDIILVGLGKEDIDAVPALVNQRKALEQEAGENVSLRADLVRWTGRVSAEEQDQAARGSDKWTSSPRPKHLTKNIGKLVLQRCRSGERQRGRADPLSSTSTTFLLLYALPLPLIALSSLS